MNILITAGNTQVPIDRVRCLTNIFSGRTGAAIALEFCGMGHKVTLLTSRPDSLTDLEAHWSSPNKRWRAPIYHTFDELDKLLTQELKQNNYDAVIHTAAVSDYVMGGVYAPAPRTGFSPGTMSWNGDPPKLIDRAAGKVKSDEPELWLRLVRAPKLIDKMRKEWSFQGILVKFKLEVGISEERLLELAEQSRVCSDADLMVANTLEGANAWAYLGPCGGSYDRIARAELPRLLVKAVDREFKERTHV